MRNFWNTVCFTYRNKVKGKFFIISTIIFTVAIVGILNYKTIQNVFIGDEEAKSSSTIVVNNETDTFIVDKEVFKEVFKDNTIEIADSKKEAEEILNGSIENVMVNISDNDKSIYKISILSKRHADQTVVSRLQEVTKQLAKYSVLTELEIDPSIQESLLVEPEIAVESYETDAESKMLVAYCVVIIFMILMNFYVQGVASTIVSEKSNRVIEVLLTSSKATELFFGKIIGNCLASMTQILILGIVGIVTFNIVDFQAIKVAGATLDFSVLSSFELIYIVIFFLLGYLLYSIMAGALAAFVSNNDDLNQSILPVTLCSMGSVALAMVFMINPTLEIIETLSYIPLLSPLIMIVRIIMVGVSTTEIFLNLAIIIATIVVFAVVGSKLYSKGTLNDNKKLTLKAILK